MTNPDPANAVEAALIKVNAAKNRLIAAETALEHAVSVLAPRSPASGVHHVCGLQGFGALGDVCEACEADSRKTAQPFSADSFQSRVAPWMQECFGPEISADIQERCHRFLEESLERVQSSGCTASEAHRLVDYVFGRPSGDKAQETGGVMVTLAALSLADGIDMHAAGETELVRIWGKIDKIRAKQAAKPKHSPLPEGQPFSAADAEVGSKWLTRGGETWTFNQFHERDHVHCQAWFRDARGVERYLYANGRANGDGEDHPSDIVGPAPPVEQVEAPKPECFDDVSQRDNSTECVIRDGFDMFNNYIHSRTPQNAIAFADACGARLVAHLKSHYADLAASQERVRELEGKLKYAEKQRTMFRELCENYDFRVKERDAEIGRLKGELEIEQLITSEVSNALMEDHQGNIEHMLAVGMLGKATTVIGRGRLEQLHKAESDLAAARESADSWKRNCIEQVEKSNNWISLSERLPTEGDGDSKRGKAIFIDDEGVTWLGFVRQPQSRATHWMPIPPHPTAAASAGKGRQS